MTVVELEAITVYIPDWEEMRDMVCAYVGIALDQMLNDSNFQDVLYDAECVAQDDPMMNCTCCEYTCEAQNAVVRCIFQRVLVEIEEECIDAFYEVYSSAVAS